MYSGCRSCTAPTIAEAFFCQSPEPAVRCSPEQETGEHQCSIQQPAMLDPPLLQLTPLKIFFILLILFTSQTSLAESATRTYGSSCNSCNNAPSSSFLGGQSLGNGVRGVLGNKLEHIAGFFNGLGGGCSGCSSTCGSPGCGSQYVPASNPCSSGGCYSSSCSTCSSSSSSYSVPAHHSNTVTVIVEQPSSSSSVYDASAYPNCQCSYLFNMHGQGNCNGQGSRSFTSDRSTHRHFFAVLNLSHSYDDLDSYPQWIIHWIPVTLASHETAFDDTPHMLHLKLRHRLGSDRSCCLHSSFMLCSPRAGGDASSPLLMERATPPSLLCTYHITPNMASG